MTNTILISVALTVLVTLIAYTVKLSGMVQQNRNDIIEERTRSIAEDKHHKSELDIIRKQLEKILNKVDKLTSELLGNGK
jgi:dsDNA-specific endonuclease/ATPase MutS2